jgi:hypothetical protein
LLALYRVDALPDQVARVARLVAGHGNGARLTHEVNARRSDAYSVTLTVRLVVEPLTGTVMDGTCPVWLRWIDFSPGTA